MFDLEETDLSAAHLGTSARKIRAGKKNVAKIACTPTKYSQLKKVTGSSTW